MFKYIIVDDYGAVWGTDDKVEAENASRYDYTVIDRETCEEVNVGARESIDKFEPQE